VEVGVGEAPGVAVWMGVGEEEDGVRLGLSVGVGGSVVPGIGVLDGVAVVCGVGEENVVTSPGAGVFTAESDVGDSLWLLDELEQAAMANITSSTKTNRTVWLRQDGGPIEAKDTRLNLRQLPIALSTHRRARYR